MTAYANKTQENKSSAVADTSAKQRGSGPVAQFKNNRPEAVAQRRLQAAADNSDRVKQLVAIQQLAGNRAGTTIQAKFVIQRAGSVGSYEDPDAGDFSSLAGAPMGAGSLFDDAPADFGSEAEREADVPDVREPVEEQQAAPLPAAAAGHRVPDPRTAYLREARAIARTLPFDDSSHPAGRAQIHHGWLGSALRDMSGSTKSNRANRVNADALTRMQKAEYGALGGAVLTSAAGGTTGLVAGEALRSSLDISDEAAKAPMTSSYSLGIGAGVLGAAYDLKGAWKTVGGVSAKSGNSKANRIQAGLETAGSLASATKSGLSTWLNIANLKDATGSVAAAATTATAGASIAMGGLDMLGGIYGYRQANKRGKALSSLRTSDRDLGRAAKIGAGVQSREKLRTGAKTLKGAASVAGGILLLLGASMSPIGWGLLAGGAVVAGAAAIINQIRKRRLKKDIVIDILNIKPLRDKWKADKKAIESQHKFWKRSARKTAMERIGKEDPLDVALRINGYTDISHCYNNYLGTVAGKLYDEGILRNDPTSLRIIQNLGLKLNREKGEPNATKIAAKLSV